MFAQKEYDEYLAATRYADLLFRHLAPKEEQDAADQAMNEALVRYRYADLAACIRNAAKRHSIEFPDGDWKEINEELGRLFWEAVPILEAAGYNPWEGGNEGRAKILDDLASSNVDKND